jgi:hypothetical protein
MSLPPTPPNYVIMLLASQTSPPPPSLLPTPTNPISNTYKSYQTTSIQGGLRDITNNNLDIGDVGNIGTTHTQKEMQEEMQEDEVSSILKGEGGTLTKNK